MHGKAIFISVLLWNVCDCQRIQPEIESYDGEVEYTGGHQNSHRRVASTIFKTVNKYVCSLDALVEGSHLIVYGTKGWTFPKQDVNLTLRYPINNSNSTLSGPFPDEYIITGFRVILFIDGPGSEGFIVDGGVLKETITLSFVSTHITSLRYQFWVYGVRKDTSDVIELNNQYRLCV